MRKPVIPRFILLLLLFVVIFVTLVHVQFARRTDFTLREGDLVIRGNYLNNVKQISNIYSLTGKVSVFFGGMEFLPPQPHLMRVADNEVYFILNGGPELVFTTQYSGGAVELVIRADYSVLSTETTHIITENLQYYSIEIPFKALPTSVVQENSQQLLVNANGNNYTFSRNTQRTLNAGNGFVHLEIQNPVISYRVVPDKEMVNPRDFIIPAVLNGEEYETALALWLDQSYMLWNRSAATSGESSGDLINAYMSEALKRGTFKAAAAAVSGSWNPANVFFEASPFIGRLDTALRTISTTEREQLGRLARLINEKSLEFLKEFRIIDFLAIRGYDGLMDDTAEILRKLDPAAMTSEQAAGILEGHLGWARYRPGRHNPFDRFVDQALFVITGNLRKNSRGNGALVFTKTGNLEEEADAELNLRIGKSLLRYEDETRNALGKTLIFSVLSLADRSGTVPRRIKATFIGERERLDSQKIYRICFAGENYARAQTSGGGLWAWTAASKIYATHSEGRLELNVEFPAGETHYLIIRGIKPFTTLQFNGIPYNNDNQFERYDYSGWTYSGSEQSLLIKIRQRLPTEKIIIIF